jgi:dTMP kinase
MKTRGIFITFEGIDGCGKTSQLELLAAHFAAREIPCLATREPGGTALGLRLREALLDPAHAPVEPEAELLLYAADRAQHVRQLIRPALAAGRVVLSDRYADATEAYQGYGRGFDLELVRSLNELATGHLAPDLTLLFDLEVEAGLERVGRRSKHPSAAPDRLDREPLDFHERVRRGYHEIAARDPARFRLIPAHGSLAETHQLVLSAVAALIDHL